MSDEMRKFQKEVGEWGVETFPNADNESITNHLSDEVEELDLAAYPDLDGVRVDWPEEAADCFMLLLHLAHRNGFDLLDEARKKFEVNKQRTWNTDSGNGYTRHDDPTPARTEGGPHE